MVYCNRVITMRCDMRKVVFGVTANCPDHPVETYSLIRTFAILFYVLQYPMILKADSDGPDETAPLHRLISSFALHLNPKTLFRMAKPTVILETSTYVLWYFFARAALNKAKHSREFFPNYFASFNNYCKPLLCGLK